MATVDPFPDVNHLALSTTGCVCHGHYLVSGDTLSAVNTEQPNEATPPDEMRIVRDAKYAGSVSRAAVKKAVKDVLAEATPPDEGSGVHEPGTRRYCPTCGQGIGGT